MKKLFIAVTFILILCLSVVSCDSETTDMENTVDSKTTSSVTEQVTVTVTDKEYGYYTLINETVTAYDGDWWGDRIEIIGTNADIQLEFLEPHIDTKIFENNYVLKIIHKGTIQNRFGFYGLEKNGYGGYNISLDYIGESVEDNNYYGSFTSSYVIVPKEQIEYVNGYYQVSINASPKSNLSVNPLAHSKGVLPQEPKAWIIDKSSEIISHYGLNNLNESYFDDSGKALILYLPQSISNNFIKEITLKNGDVKLTVENYIDTTLGKNDSACFYQIPGVDTTKLSSDFKTNITIENIEIPRVPKTAYMEPNIDVADAIMIAQTSFFNYVGSETIEGYNFSAQCIKGDSDLYWYILIRVKGFSWEDDKIDPDLDCVYIINKATGEIVDIITPKYIETEDWNQPTPKKTGNGGVS